MHQLNWVNHLAKNKNEWKNLGRLFPSSGTQNKLLKKVYLSKLYACISDGLRVWRHAMHHGAINDRSHSAPLGGGAHAARNSRETAICQNMSCIRSWRSVETVLINIEAITLRNSGDVRQHHISNRKDKIWVMNGQKWNKSIAGPMCESNIASTECQYQS